MAVDTIRASTSVTLKETASAGSGTRTDAFDRTRRTEYAIGTGAGAASTQWHDYRTLAGASESLVLAGGLTNGLGAAVTFTKIKLLDVLNTGNAPITLGGGSNAIIPALPPIPAGGCVQFRFVDANGWAVTAGTGDLLQVAGTAGQTYEIAIAGE